MSDFYSQPAAGGFGAPQGGGFGAPQGGGFGQSPIGQPGFDGGFGGLPAPLPEPEPEPAKKSRSSKSKSKEKGPKQPKKKKTPVRRQMQFAALVAVIGAVAFYLVLSGSSEPETWVARTAGDVAAGVPLTAAQLEYIQVPQDLVEKGAVSGATAAEAEKAAEEVIGLVSQYPLPGKSQVHADTFGVQATLAEALTPTQRLVSLHAPISTAVAGSLVVGDRVDILTVHNGITRVVAYDVPIVAVTVSEDRYNSVADAQAADKSVTPGDVLPGDPIPGMYTVRVEADQTAALTAADAEGSVVFAYRAPGATTVEIPDFNPDQLAEFTN